MVLGRPRTWIRWRSRGHSTWLECPLRKSLISLLPSFGSMLSAAAVPVPAPVCFSHPLQIWIVVKFFDCHFCAWGLFACGPRPAALSRRSDRVRVIFSRAHVWRRRQSVNSELARNIAWLRRIGMSIYISIPSVYSAIRLSCLSRPTSSAYPSASSCFSFVGPCWFLT